MHRKLQAMDPGKADWDSQESEFLVDYIGWELSTGLGQRQEDTALVLFAKASFS